MPATMDGKETTIGDYNETGFKIRASPIAVSCTNTIMGGDPSPGVDKHCFCGQKVDTASMDWKVCAAEGADCACTGTVLYYRQYTGEDYVSRVTTGEDALSSGQAYKARTSSDTLQCSSAVFGEVYPSRTTHCMCGTKIPRDVVLVRAH